MRRVRGHQHRWKPWNNDTFKVLPSYGPVVPMPSLDTFMTLIPEFVPARNGSPPVPCFASPIATLSRAGQLRASPTSPADAVILQEIRWPALELLVLDARTAPTLTTPTPAGEAAGYTPMYACRFRPNLYLHSRGIRAVLSHSQLLLSASRVPQSADPRRRQQRRCVSHSAVQRERHPRTARRGFPYQARRDRVARSDRVTDCRIRQGRHDARSGRLRAGAVPRRRRLHAAGRVPNTCCNGAAVPHTRGHLRADRARVGAYGTQGTLTILPCVHSVCGCVLVCVAPYTKQHNPLAPAFQVCVLRSVTVCVDRLPEPSLFPVELSVWARSLARRPVPSGGLATLPAVPRRIASTVRAGAERLRVHRRAAAVAERGSVQRCVTLFHLPAHGTNRLHNNYRLHSAHTAHRLHSIPHIGPSLPSQVSSSISSLIASAFAPRTAPPPPTRGPM